MYSLLRLLLLPLLPTNLLPTSYYLLPAICYLLHPTTCYHRPLLLVLPTTYYYYLLLLLLPPPLLALCTALLSVVVMLELRDRCAVVVTGPSTAVAIGGGESDPDALFLYPLPIKVTQTPEILLPFY